MTDISTEELLWEMLFTWLKKKVKCKYFASKNGNILKEVKLSGKQHVLTSEVVQMTASKTS